MMNRRSLIAGLLLICSSVLLHAHGGMIHVMGTVTTITETSITVETADKKSVEVQLTGETTFLNGSAPATRKDVKVGDRVVIHAAKVKEALQAHEVRFSPAAAVPSH